MFQYATSFTASEALAQKVKAGDADGDEALPGVPVSAGGSKYPIDLLKDAGVDMTTDEPLELTMKEMNRVMDEMEKILRAGVRRRPPNSGSAKGSSRAPLSRIQESGQGSDNPSDSRGPWERGRTPTDPCVL